MGRTRENIALYHSIVLWALQVLWGTRRSSELEAATLLYFVWEQGQGRSPTLSRKSGDRKLLPSPGGDIHLSARHYPWSTRKPCRHRGIAVQGLFHEVVRSFLSLMEWSGILGIWDLNKLDVGGVKIIVYHFSRRKCGTGTGVVAWRRRRGPGTASLSQSTLTTQ